MLLADESFKQALMEKRKTLQYKDLATLVQNDARFAFLREIIPLGMPLEKAMQAIEKMEEEEKGDEEAEEMDVEEGKAQETVAAPEEPNAPVLETDQAPQEKPEKASDSMPIDPDQ